MACREMAMGSPWEFAIFGLGKLGGMELNFSSDIDLMFVYSTRGQYRWCKVCDQSGVFFPFV